MEEERLERGGGEERNDGKLNRKGEVRERQGRGEKDDQRQERRDGKQERRRE